MYKNSIVLLCLLWATLSFSQVSNAEKTSVRDKTAYIQHRKFIDSAVFYKKKDIAKSISFIESALTILNRDDKKQEATAFYTLGDIYLFWEQYDLAISNYKNALQSDTTPETILKLGKAYFLNENYPESYAAYNRLTESHTLSSYQNIILYEGIGDVYAKQNELENALINYQKALQIAQQNLVTPKITDLNSKIADVYSRLGAVDKAEAYYGNSLDLANRQNAGRAVVEKEKVADFYNRKNAYDKEIQLRQSALKDVESMEEEAVTVQSGSRSKAAVTPQSINYKIANAYIAKNKPKAAIPYLQKSIADASEEEDLVVQKDATQTLSEVYATVGNYDKALENYQKYVALVDTLYIKKEEEIAQVAQFSKAIALQQSRITSLEKEQELSESRYQLAVKEQELIKENSKRQQLIIYVLIFGLLLMALTTYFFYRSNKQQQLTNHVLALRSLRTQMNPHFIFNALNSVNNFVARNDERSTNRFLSDFSTLMRMVLNHSEEDFIPLSKEIELLKLYVKLEHSRFPEKFDYHIIVDEHINIEAFRIPPMLLQPYVENAIWHGLRYKKEKGSLRIEFRQVTTESLEICIEDDGIGRKRSAALKTKNQQQQQSKGTGNIKQRLAILNRMYNNKVTVRIEDLFEDRTGTRVLLTLKHLK